MTASLLTGPLQLAFESETCNGSGSASVPFIRWPGSEYDSSALPAVLVTVPAEVAV